MIFCDTHSHIYLPEFNVDREFIVSRAIEKGVKKILLSNVDKDTVRPLLDLCEAFPDLCYPILGLHPCSVGFDYQEQIKIIFENIKNSDIVGIGEIGIDLYWDKTFLIQQQEALEIQLKMAANCQKPVVVHTRDSFDVAFEVISGVKGIKGVYHCFSGNLENAKEAVDSSFYLGIGGVITFKNSVVLQEVVREIPLDYLLLETDSPYLAPVPYRGKRNESSYIPIIAQKIAELKSISIEEVAEVTSNNALKLFNIQN
ncbi:MAG: TatD family hydrolase [Bacteroidota bacterium]